MNLAIHLDADKFQLSRSEFPTFFLQIKVPALGVMETDPVIRCDITTRKSVSLPMKEKTVEVPVKCVGVDECYFIFEDNDRASEYDVSKGLLRPMLAGTLE